MPRIVLFIDELADLMAMYSAEVERTLCRLAQMARATGMHLVVATQRPSINVITGLIKANFPARIAFAVASNTDSRVIIDTSGAEQLLGRGDMLFLPDAAAPQRVQGCFIDDDEIDRLAAFGRMPGRKRKRSRRRGKICSSAWLSLKIPTICSNRRSICVSVMTRSARHCCSGACVSVSREQRGLWRHCTKWGWWKTEIRR